MAEPPKSKTERWDKAFRHQATGIILPKTIIGFAIEERTSFEGGNYQSDDIGLRYRGDDERIDIYLTKKKDLVFDPEDPYQNHSFALGDVIAAIKEAEKRGYYCDVDSGKQANIDHFGDDGDDALVMADIAIKLRQSVTDDKESDWDKQLSESSIAITFLRGYQLKVRYTFTLPEDNKNAEELRKKRDEFHEQIQALIVGATLLEAAEKAVANLRAKPTDKEAMRTIINFVEESTLIKITVSSSVLPFLFGDETIDRSTELLGAFIAGNLEAQLNKVEFVDQPLAGVLFMLSNYESLKKAGRCQINPILESWILDRDAGTLDATIKARAAAPAP